MKDNEELGNGIRDLELEESANSKSLIPNSYSRIPNS